MGGSWRIGARGMSYGKVKVTFTQRRGEKLRLLGNMTVEDGKRENSKDGSM